MWKADIMESISDAIPARSTSAGRRKAKERPWVLGSLVSLSSFLSFYSSSRLRTLFGYCRTVSIDFLSDPVTLLTSYITTVSQPSAVVLLPKKDVNAAPTAASAVPIVARAVLKLLSLESVNYK